ncbi:class C sortase [Parvimonas sp. C2]|uniref:class C sortase n=1 Tax=Parvimonas sp. C2 TaxID=3110692 RepID=UPI002B4667BF|nr:class C sortase [Parvimonas sp. C2]MEB3073529.1 class C sortase [Parvimonas sp. C2]
MKSKKVRMIGYLAMIIGISLPIYTFTNLVVNDYRQKSMYEEFKSLQEKMSEEEKSQLENSIKKYNNNVKSSNIVDPFSNEEYNTVYEFKKDDPDGIFAYIRIPAINLYKPIRLDASYKHLDKGVAHIDGTALPTGGMGNRSVIAGHRGWYKDVMFLNISKLKKGDKVYIERAGKTLTYVVSNTEIIKPYEWEKLEAEKDRDILTLLTCDPAIPPSPYRMLVNCERLVESTQEQVKEKDEVNKDVKNVSILVYSITGGLWIVFIFTVYKFIKFLIKRK